MRSMLKVLLCVLSELCAQSSRSSQRKRGPLLSVLMLLALATQLSAQFNPDTRQAWTKSS